MSVITSNQVKTLRIAFGKLSKSRPEVFDDAWYRLALVNVGRAGLVEGRPSTKLLSQAGFEGMMALMEDYGYRHPNVGDNYWRMRDASRTGYATSRQVFEIRRLTEHQHQYSLEGLCRRASNGFGSIPEKLTPGQARSLIEALKSITTRTEGHVA